MLKRINNEVQDHTTRELLIYLSTECSVPDEVIQKLKWGIENSYVYNKSLLRLLDRMKSTWESITNVNDPNKVNHLKNELSKYANLFFKVSDRYMRPQESIDIVGKAKDPTYRELLMDLSTECRIPGDVINNMISVINNPDLYEAEIVNAIDEMKQDWLSTNFDDPGYSP
ncbi:hypothetical protein M9Y10_032172 [Tritrichomonas musculus]|uniref:Uncharacterized protein n=1 Tax=Tritrichomonas musculus TaxID=1915356 RepID=A0ABR2GZ77_9EUKA